MTKGSTPLCGPCRPLVVPTSSTAGHRGPRHLQRVQCSNNVFSVNWSRSRRRPSVGRPTSWTRAALGAVAGKGHWPGDHPSHAFVRLVAKRAPWPFAIGLPIVAHAVEGRAGTGPRPAAVGTAPRVLRRLPLVVPDRPARPAALPAIEKGRRSPPNRRWD